MLRRPLEWICMAIKAHMSFPLREKRDLDGSIAAHFAQLGYRLDEKAPNQWIFRRGSKMGSLWRCDIRLYDTTLSVQSVAEPDGTTRVSCQWNVWTFGTRTKQTDVTLLEAEGRELKAILRRTDPPHSL
jgi:hypothetical protein